MPRRLAYAGVVDDYLVFGDPERRHLILTPDTIVLRTHDGDQVVPWTAIRRLRLDARQSRFRFPGVIRAAAATLLAAVGLADLPGTADFEVSAETDDGTVPLPCDGYLGTGYWAPHAVVLAGLAHVLATDPRARDALDDPARVLDIVAGIARPGVTPNRADKQLRAALTS